MGAPNITKTVSAREDFESTEDYADYLAGLLARNLREILWILTGNLDVKNIKAKSITADRMSVKELSAITADLGHITAGLIEAVTIVGSLIKTANSGQRVEISSTDNLLLAENTLGNTIKMKPNVGTTPDIEFQVVDGDYVRMFLLPEVFSINSTLSLTDIALASGKGINLYPASGYKVRFTSWDSIFSNSAGGGSGKTLQEELNDIWAAIASLSGP